jgi:hypothetical protein
MGIFGISDEIIREEETNVGSRLQARTGFQKSMNWLMGVDQYGNKRSKAQRTVASSLKILAALGVTAATGGAAAPLLAAAIGGATAAGISYGVGQNVKARARGTAGGGATIADVSKTQRQDYVNAALYTATAGTAGVYKQSLQKGVNTARTQLAQQSVTVQPTNVATAPMPNAGQAINISGSTPSTSLGSQWSSNTVAKAIPDASATWKAGLQETVKGGNVTYMDVLRQAPKDIAKFEKKMQGKLGEFGYKKAKEYTIKGIEQGKKAIKKKINKPVQSYNEKTEEYEGDYEYVRDAQGNVYKQRIK